MEKITFTVERAKPGKFALRMKHAETGVSVVVSEGRANEVYDLKEAVESVAAGKEPPAPTPADA
jgi:hypothetical protein